MSYRQEFYFDFMQTIVLEYSLGSNSLKVDSWKLFFEDREIIPDRHTSEEIELMLAKFLEKEYSRNALNYFQDRLEARLEKRYEGDR